LGLNRFGREKNRTEINRFEPVLGSIRFKKKKFGLVVYFGSKPDRTGNAQPYVRLRRGTLAGVYGAAATVSWRLVLG
jgi:hypothetical protein